MKTFKVLILSLSLAAVTNGCGVSQSGKENFRPSATLEKTKVPPSVTLEKTKVPPSVILEKTKEGDEITLSHIDKDGQGSIYRGKLKENEPALFKNIEDDQDRISVFTMSNSEVLMVAYSPNKDASENNSSTVLVFLLIQDGENIQYKLFLSEEEMSLSSVLGKLNAYAGIKGVTIQRAVLELAQLKKESK